MTFKFHLLKIRYVTCIASRARNCIEFASSECELMKTTQKNMSVNYISYKNNKVLFNKNIRICQSMLLQGVSS